MKRFSILLVLAFVIHLIVGNIGKVDFNLDNVAKEILSDEKDEKQEPDEYWYNPDDKDQHPHTAEESSVSTDENLVSDKNVSEERKFYGTDNKANLRELYYKDGYIYFKYLICKGDKINVGGVQYKQTNKVTIETKLIEKCPSFDERTEEDYTYNEGEPYCGSSTFSIEKFNDDFGRVYVGELSEEDAKKYRGITAKVTMYYDASNRISNGLSMTRSVDYSISIY